MHTLCAGHFAFNVSSPPTRQEGYPAVLQEVTKATQQILGWPKKSFRFFVTAYGKTQVRYNWQSRLPASLRAGPGSSPPCYPTSHPQADSNPSQTQAFLWSRDKRQMAKGSSPSYFVCLHQNILGDEGTQRRGELDGVHI